MKLNRTNAVLVVAVALVAAATGFLLGRRSPVAPSVEQLADNSAAARAAPAAGTARRPLYYRHPMGLDDTSPLPKKDSMGMDYVPVYADEQPADSRTVTLSPEKIQLIGVRTERTARRALAQTLQASGTIAIAESRQRTVAPRFDGWIERLQVGATGAAVRVGQVLATAYSPELRATEQEYLIASGTPAMRELAAAALERLHLAGVSAAELVRLQQTRQPSSSVALLAPISGVVLEKPAVAGMKFSAGDTLFRLADLSAVWVIAEVPEQDLPRLQLGQTASFETASHPGERFSGRVAFIAPTVNEATRTVQARIELANTNGALKPGMFGRLSMSGAAAQDVARLSVSSSAVIDSGQRQIVLLSRPGGRFEPREVRLGLRSGEFVEVLSGLQEGDTVVSAANFLIDAESNLRGALSGMHRSAADADKTH